MGVLFTQAKWQGITIAAVVACGLLATCGDSKAEEVVVANYMRIMEAPVVSDLTRALTSGQTSETDADTLFKEFFANWEYNKARPIRTKLWKRLEDFSAIQGLEYSTRFTKVDRLCMQYQTINSGAGGDESQLDPGVVFDEQGGDYKTIWPTDDIAMFTKALEAGKCQLGEEQSNVGVLFLILENTSSQQISNLNFKLTLHDIGIDLSHSADGIRTSYDTSTIRTHSELKSAISFQSTEQSFEIPYMKANESIIWVLGAYLKDQNGFDDFFLTDQTVVDSVTYDLGGKTVSQNIRLPLKEKAMPINIPFGWYRQ